MARKTLSQKDASHRGARAVLYQQSIRLRLRQAKNSLLMEALGRVNAEPNFCKNSSPHIRRPRLDGICPCALEDTFGASEFVGKKLKVNGISIHRDLAFSNTTTPVIWRWHRGPTPSSQ